MRDVINLVKLSKKNDRKSHSDASHEIGDCAFFTLVITQYFSALVSS